MPDKGRYIDTVSGFSTRDDLAEILFEIDQEEVPLLTGPRVLTARQRKTLQRLEHQRSELAKERRRLERRLATMERRRRALDARISELRPPMTGADRVLTEWLVQELNNG